MRFWASGGSLFGQMKGPILMGAVMGPMMLWMLHGALMGDGASFGGLIVFVLAHVVVIGAVGLAGLFAARLSPRAQAVLQRVHKPSMAHLKVMGLSAACVAGGVHLVVHGGLGWT